jgi:hypothetical protein
LLHWPHVHPPHHDHRLQRPGSLALAQACSSAYLKARGSPCPRASAPEAPFGSRGPLPPSLWRLTLDHRTRIQEPCVAGLQPHPADRRGVRGPRNPALPVPEAGPRQGRRQAQLPAGVGRGRRALRPLQLHRPAGAHLPAGEPASAPMRRPRSSPTARWWRRPAAIRWTSSRPTRSASRWRCGRGCRVFAAGWPATSATTRCATSRRSWSRAARPTRWAARTSCCCNARSWRSSTTSRASCT